MPKVYSKRGGKKYPTDAVLIDRTTKWGNHDYVMQDEADRNRCCDGFEDYLENHPDLKDAARQELRGKDLVCWCAPKRCHGDTLLRVANSLLD